MEHKTTCSIYNTILSLDTFLYGEQKPSVYVTLVLTLKHHYIHLSLLNQFKALWETNIGVHQITHVISANINYKLPIILVFEGKM